jgi:hypothetical protein
MRASVEIGTLRISRSVLDRAGGANGGRVAVENAVRRALVERLTGVAAGGVQPALAAGSLRISLGRPSSSAGEGAP